MASSRASQRIDDFGNGAETTLHGSTEGGPMREPPVIRVVGASEHNLKNVTVEIPRGLLTVITGPSGSGKSSLAFDTIYAEGQRRYIESLSTHARQFLVQMPKPEVERIEGLPPTIAIEQRAGAVSPRSTVATTTEIHDFLRVLFAKVGSPRCWECGRPIVRQSTAQIVDLVLRGPPGQRILLLAPLIFEQRGAHRAILERVLKEGFVRARIDGEIVLIENAPALAANRKHTIEVVVDRLTISPGIAQRLADGIELATRFSSGRVVISAEVAPGRWSDECYSAALACPMHPEVRIQHLSPQLFSFNSPHGACEACSGLGVRLEFDPELVVPDRNLSLRDGAVMAWRHQGRRLNSIYAKLIQEFCERFGVLPEAPLRSLPAEKVRILMEGTAAQDQKELGASFEGVLPNLQRRWKTTESESAKQRLHGFLSEAPCDRCRGARLRHEALCVRIADRSIADVLAMTIAAAVSFFQTLSFTGDAAVIATPLLREIRQRLGFLEEVGVEYLSLNRTTASLSGGERQRIRLATQIGAGLAGVCYVLDEPTIGLHPRDTRRLTRILQRLAQMDNTVIVVEHEEEVIAGANRVIDIGPGAGVNGGRIVAQGDVQEILACPDSLTGRYLSGRTRLEPLERRRPVDWQRCVELHGVEANNLKKLGVRFPLGCLVCVTGVSGSGKSTLVRQVLLRALRRSIDRAGPRPGPYERISGTHHVNRVVEVDQTPIGRTPRSNPATYVGAFSLIRELFAKTREAKIRGYGATRFSFNVKGGRCGACEGQGVKRITMHFLPDVFVTCGECEGKRYNRETLDIRYRGRGIADVLNLSIDEAVQFFDNFHGIRDRLLGLKDVGLGYMALGQAANTLSGGEAQRIKLAAELYRSNDAHTMYVLDEPTTGLHPSDVHTLMGVLNRLVDRGHTVLVIEHNLDIIQVADWIIDLGPEGGEKGGFVVVEGPPEQVAACATSYTGQFLKDRLSGDGPWRRAVAKSTMPA